MVREDQVAAAALHVERRAEVLERDRGALDVPPGPAGAERAVPRRLAVALAAPHDAVERVLLARAVGVAAAVGEDAQHRLAVPAGHVAEGGVGGDGEVEVGLDLVDGTDLLEPLDEVDDERDRLDGADVVVRGQDPQRLHVVAEELGLALGQLDPVDADLGGPLEQRVVDVGDVLDVGHLVAGAAPGTVEQVEGDVRRGVAHVGGVVRRDPADVEAGRALGTGLDELARRGVVHPHGGTDDGEGRDVGRGPAAHAGKPIRPRTAARG